VLPAVLPAVETPAVEPAVALVTPPVVPPPVVLAKVTETAGEICALVLPAASRALARNQVVPELTPITTDHCPFAATTADPSRVPPVVADELGNEETNTVVPDSAPDPDTVTNWLEICAPFAGEEMTTLGGGVVSTTGAVPDPPSPFALDDGGRVDVAPMPLDPARATVPLNPEVATDDAFNPAGTV
jgi:hypothetical protein